MPEQRRQRQDDPYAADEVEYGVGDAQRGLEDHKTETGNTYLEGVNQFDNTFANTPILGWITGSDARYNAALEEKRRREQDARLEDLRQGVPTADQIYTEGTTDEYGDLIGGESQLAGFGPSSQQNLSQNALYDIYQRGGYTPADIAQRRMASMQRAQEMRGANQAALQQMAMRGMGGGGGELAARLNASQAGNQSQAMADAQMQMGAQQRAMQALAGFQGGANTIQSQELQRRATLDDFNQKNMDWRRGREQRNTGTRNQAQQQEFENRANIEALQSNQFSGFAGQRQHEQDRQDENTEDLVSAIGSLF